MLSFVVAARCVLAVSFALPLEEFSRYHREITGREPEPGALVLGIDPGVSRNGNDAYRIKSKGAGAEIVGSNMRSVWYGLYDLLERRGGCCWFWDGDRVPKKDSIDLTELDVFEEARFEWRAIRYFAHRGLTRFQAEHWGPEEWRREIDWLLKRRINVFMLRLGQDDLFQRAFPDVCSYPDASKDLPGHGHWFDNRTLFWPLEFRGELRKKVQRYAFDRGLEVPEDFGTMTHWYSRTPEDFLEKMKPSFLPQSTDGYSERNGLVWDIRDSKWVDAYWKLTQTAIREYGKPGPGLLHTIGLGERNCFSNRADNLALKIRSLKTFLEKAHKDYPDSKVLLAGWDFYFTWMPDEVRSLLGHLDPKRDIIWDYEGDATLDSRPEFAGIGNNFTKWGVMGKFPYTYSIFLAYEDAIDFRANYPLIEGRQKLVQNDPMCKGYVLWPESSHTDTLLLQYFTANAWSQNAIGIKEILPKFCSDRYGDQSNRFREIWECAIPISYLLGWGGNYGKYAVGRERVYPEYDDPKDESAFWVRQANKFRPVSEAFDSIVSRLQTIEWTDEFAKRDSVDLARMAADRRIIAENAMMMDAFCRWKAGEASEELVHATTRRYVRLGEAMADLLELHTDYSLWESYERLNAIREVTNTNFPSVLLQNALCPYCSSQQYEAARYWYLPIMRQTAEIIEEAVRKGNRSEPSPDGEPYYDAMRRMHKMQLQCLRPTRPRSQENFRKVLRAFQDAVHVEDVGARAFKASESLVVVERGFWQNRRIVEAIAGLTNALARVTGSLPLVCEEGDTLTVSAPRIYVGRTDAAVRAGVDYGALRNGDWRIKTVPGAAYLCGKTADSILWAVTEFVERHCRYRFLCPDGQDPYVFDPGLEVACDDITVRPALYQRSVYNGIDVNKMVGPCQKKGFFSWQRRRGLAETASIEGRYRVSSQTGERCHTTFNYLPPEKHFKEHPEWYSMGTDGKRHGVRCGRSQLCYTNPDVFERVYEALEGFVRADRAKFGDEAPKVYDFTQQDNCDNGLCFCPDCRNEIAKYNRRAGGHAEGGDAGLQLQFVNRLARRIRQKFPDVRIRTFAYVTTERAPKPGSIAVEPNVIIWWCDVYSHSDHMVPLKTPGHFNMRQAEELDEWLALTKNITIWDYMLYRDEFPEASPEAIKSDADYFAAKGVDSLFMESEYHFQPFYELNVYLMSKLYVNPALDVDTLVANYCQVYGKGADKMIEAIGYLRKTIAESRSISPVAWHSRILEWRNRKTLEEFAKKVKIAYDKESEGRVRARIALVLASTFKDLIGVYMRMPGQEALVAKGVKRYSRFAKEFARFGFLDDLKRESFEKQIDERIELATLRFKDIPEELKSVDAKDLVCVDYHAAPISSLLVADSESERGKAQKTRHDHDHSKAFPFLCGVYDFTDKFSANFEIAENQAYRDEKYHWYKLGPVTLGRNSSFWFPRTWINSFVLRDKYIISDGLVEDPNHYEVWVSVKFQGPAYVIGSSKENCIRVDRLLFRRIRK